MNKSNIKEQLEINGKIIYPNTGVSMMPLLRQHRDLMIIKAKDSPLKKYDAVLFMRKDKYVLHRILNVNSDGSYYICGDNQTNKELVKEEQIIGVLTGVIRDKKEITVDDFGYKLYVHLWCDFFYIRVLIIKIRNLMVRIVRKLFK